MTLRARLALGWAAQNATAAAGAAVVEAGLKVNQMICADVVAAAAAAAAVVMEVAPVGGVD